MLSWRLRFLCLYLMLGSIIIRDIVCKRASKGGSSKAGGFSKVFSKNVIFQLMHRSDFVSVFSKPLDEDTITAIGKDVSEAIAKEFEISDPFLVTAYVTNGLKKVSPGSDPEKYATALLDSVTQILVGNKILDWMNIFKTADKTVNDIINALSSFIPTTEPTEQTTVTSITTEPSLTSITSEATKPSSAETETLASAKDTSNIGETATTMQALVSTEPEIALASTTEDKSTSVLEANSASTVPEASPSTITDVKSTTSIEVNLSSPAEASSINPAEASSASPAEVSLASVSEASPTSLSEANPTSLAEANPTKESPAEATPTEVSPAETSPSEASPAEASLTKASPSEASPTKSSPTEAILTSLADTSSTKPAEISPIQSSSTNLAETCSPNADEENPISNPKTSTITPDKPSTLPPDIASTSSAQVSFNSTAEKNPTTLGDDANFSTKTGKDLTTLDTIEEDTKFTSGTVEKLTTPPEIFNTNPISPEETKAEIKAMAPLKADTPKKQQASDPNATFSAPRKADGKPKSITSDKNVITIDIAELMNIFKKDLAQRLRQEKNFRNAFSDNMLPSALHTLSSAIAHFLAKAFKLPRTVILPLENGIINLVGDDISTLEIFADKISSDLGFILKAAKLLSPCVIKIQASMAAKAISAAIENFLSTSIASGVGLCTNGNSYSSHFSILNGLDMLPYVGPNAVSQKFSPVMKAAKASEQSKKFSKAMFLNLMASSRFTEQFLLGIPKSSYKLIANTLGNYMAEAFGSCSPAYFADTYSKALLSYPEILSHKAYARIISLATTKVLYSLGYFVSGSDILQAAIASNAVIRAIVPRAQRSSSVDYAKAMNIPWGTPIVGSLPVHTSDETKNLFRKPNSKLDKSTRKKRECTEEQNIASETDYPLDDKNGYEEIFELYFSNFDDDSFFEKELGNDLTEFYDLNLDEDDDLFLGEYDSEKQNNEDAGKNGDEYKDNNGAKSSVNSLDNSDPGIKGEGKIETDVKAAGNDPGVRLILDILPKLLANKLHSSTALFTSLSLVGIRKVVDLFAQAIAVHFGFEPAVYFIDAYNKNLGGKLDTKEIQAGIESLLGAGITTRKNTEIGVGDNEKTGNGASDIETFFCPKVIVNVKMKSNGGSKSSINTYKRPKLSVDAGGGNKAAFGEAKTSVTIAGVAPNGGTADGTGGRSTSSAGKGKKNGKACKPAEETTDVTNGNKGTAGAGRFDSERFNEKVNSFNSRLAGFASNNIDSDFGLCVPALAKALTEALKVAGILNTNFSLLTADQLAVALVAKLSSLIATSLDAKGVKTDSTSDLNAAYDFNMDVGNPPLDYGWSPKPRYIIPYNSLRNTQNNAFNEDFRMYNSKNQNLQFGSEWDRDVLL